MYIGLPSLGLHPYTSGSPIPALFANGEAGVSFQTYDPLRYSGPVTMWQDTARTTPITAVEQAVGSIRDTARANSTIYLEQASGSLKPVLTARINRLENTENLLSVSWATVGTVTVNSAQNVTIASTGANRIEQNETAAVGSTWRGYFLLSGTGVVRVALVDNGGAFPSTVSGDITLTSTPTPYIIDRTITDAAATGIIWRVLGGTALGGTVTITGADLRTSTDASLNIPPYQRVGATSSDYDTAGFPHRLKFDGSDDFMSCALDMSTTDKMTAWAGGLLKTSDAATAVLHEFTAGSGTPPGTFAAFSPGGVAPNYSGRSTGTAVATATTTNIYPAPVNAVLTTGGDIANDVAFVQVNNDAPFSVSADQGTGNYSNSTLYVASRAGTSLFSGLGFTSLTILGRTATSNERVSVRTYVAGLAKIV